MCIENAVICRFREVNGLESFDRNEGLSERVVGVSAEVTFDLFMANPDRVGAPWEQSGLIDQGAVIIFLRA